METTFSPITHLRAEEATRSLQGAGHMHTPLADLWDLVCLIPNEAEEEMKASEHFQLGGYWDRDLATRLLMWFIENRQTEIVELSGKITALKSYRAADDIELVRARTLYDLLDNDLRLVAEMHGDLMGAPTPIHRVP
jgi:hypothetical protein